MDRLLYNQRQQLPSGQSITNIQEGSGDNDMKEYTDKMMSHLQEEGMIDPVAFAFLEKAMRGKGVRSVGRAIRGQLGKVKGAVLGGIKEDESGLGEIIQKGLNLFTNGRRQAQEMGARGRGLFANAEAAARAGQGRLAGVANDLEARARGAAGALEEKARGAAGALEGRARTAAEILQDRTDNLRSLGTSLGGKVRTAAEQSALEAKVAAERAKAGLSGAEPPSSLEELVPQTKRSIPSTWQEASARGNWFQGSDAVGQTKRSIPSTWQEASATGNWFGAKSAATEELVPNISAGELASSIDPRKVDFIPTDTLGDDGRMERSAATTSYGELPEDAQRVSLGGSSAEERERLIQEAQERLDRAVIQRQEEGGGRQVGSLANFTAEAGEEGAGEVAETFGKQPSEGMISRLRRLGQNALKTKKGKELHAKLKGDTPGETSDNVIEEMINQAKGEQSAAGKRQMAAMASSIKDDPEIQSVLDRFSAKHPELIERLKKRRAQTEGQGAPQLEGGADEAYEGELGHSGAKSFRSSPAERLARSDLTEGEYTQTPEPGAPLDRFAMDDYINVRYPAPINVADSIPPIPDDEFAGAEERGVDLGEEMKPMGQYVGKQGIKPLADTRGFGQSYAERQEALRGFGGFGSSIDRTAQQQADPNVGNAVSDLGVKPAAVAPAPLEDEWGQKVEPKFDDFGEVIKPKVGFAGDGVLREAPVINANLNVVPNVNPYQPYIDIAARAPKDSEFGVPMRPKVKATGELAHSDENPFGGVSQADFDKLPLPKRATPLPKFDTPIPQPKRPVAGLESPEEVAARVAKRAGARPQRMDDDAPNIEDIPKNIISGTGETAGEGGGQYVVARPSEVAPDALDSSRFAKAAAANNTPKTTPETPATGTDPAQSSGGSSVASTLTDTGEAIDTFAEGEAAITAPELALPGVDVASLTGDIATAGLGALTMGAGWLLGKVGDLAGDIKSRTATTAAPVLQLGKTISSYATQFGTEQ